MGGISFWQLAVVVILFVLLFGRGKISAVMGDVAKGITSFRKGLKEDVDTASDKIEEGADKAADAAEKAIDVTPREERKDA